MGGGGRGMARPSSCVGDNAEFPHMQVTGVCRSIILQISPLVSK